MSLEPDEKVAEMLTAGQFTTTAGSLPYTMASGGTQGLITPYPTIKDSGQRQSFESGMVRDVTEGKIDYSLIIDGPMFDRWAIHLTNGAKKYDKRNWMKANGRVEYERFKESALRHFLQWFKGEVDEDHAAAVYFNINGAEYTKTRL